MIDCIINIFVWTFAFYGVLEFIKNLFFLFTYTKCRADGINVIITAKNQEEQIECILRSALFKIFYGKEEYIKNIIFVDLKSDDSTMEIAKKLEIDYDIIKVLSWKECKELIDSINSC